jgi:hypothetical protein
VTKIGELGTTQAATSNRRTLRNNPEDTLLHSHRRENLKSYKEQEHLYRGIKEFERSYQSISNLVKYETDDVLADYHNILNRWKNLFSQLLNMHNISDIRQREIYAAEMLVTNSSHFKVQIAFAM